VAMGGFINFVFTNLFAAVSVASTSLVARAWGAEAFAQARSTLGQALVISFFCSIPLLVVGFPLAGPILRLMGLNGEALILGSYYLQALLIGNLLAFPAMILFSGLRGSGNTRTPMVITGLLNLVHIGIAYVLIFGALGFPQMGVQGAALAILATNAGGGLIAILVVCTRKGELYLRPRHLLPQHRLYREILRLAAPVFWEQLIFRSAQLVFMRFVSALGEVALAANQIANSIESISYMSGWGFGVAATTLSGQYVGSGQARMAERSVWRTMWFSLTILSLFGLLFILFGKEIASIFGGTPEIIAMAGIAI
jgi:MATE family multidrug resistance protein